MLRMNSAGKMPFKTPAFPPKIGGVGLYFWVIKNQPSFLLYNRKRYAKGLILLLQDCYKLNLVSSEAGEIRLRAEDRLRECPKQLLETATNIDGITKWDVSKPWLPIQLLQVRGERGTRGRSLEESGGRRTGKIV